MTSTNVRVRFAPSPTGLLHIGSARTALFNYLFARHHQGILILRIEDTDLERSTRESMDRIIEDLHWMGISWQEGPNEGGPEGPYLQSQRLPLYRDYSERLSHEGKAYKCFCSNERLDSLREHQLSKGMMPRYDGRCRSLSQEEVLRMESDGLRPALRFRVGTGPIIFEDMVHGRMTFASEGIGDFIIVRSDGMPAYNFACVLDDHFMHVTHVIRGEDHLSNTPRQIMIYRALGWEPPVFAHHPLILGSDRSPLSKRHGATAVSQYREDGFLPEALLNYLLLLGWTPPSGEEILPMEKIVETFSLNSLSKSAPIHSVKKLEWLNTSYLRSMEDGELAERLIPYLEKAGLPPGSMNHQYLGQVAGALKENLVVLSQAEEYLGIFFDERFQLDEEAKAILADPANQETLRMVLEGLERTVEINPGDWPSLFSQLAKKTGRKGRAFYAPLRAGITGKMKGPELIKTIPILGRERVIRRMKIALSTL
jgi:nondiscriminating glutamyl-tRNA synthetase